MTETQSKTVVHNDPFVPPVPHAVPLSPEQKAAAKEDEARRKAADEKAAATAKADADFKAAVADAAAKRSKALEGFTSPTLDGITCEAYEATKGPGDPPFAEVVQDYKGKLATHADSVIRTGLPEVPSPFEKKVAQLLGDKRYKDLGAQSQVSWGDSEARDAASDYEGDEGEKGVLAKGKSDAKTDKK